MRIIVVDDNRDRSAAVCDALRAADCTVIAQISSSAALYEALDRHDVDVVIASMSTPDRDTLESLRQTTDRRARPIVMFVEAGGEDMAEEAMRAGVSAYVVDGFAAGRVRPILQVAIARFNEFQRLRGELERSRTALAERKIIERAKGVLMAQRHLSESEAYTLLRRTAMAQSQKMVDVARSILSVADLLKP